MSLVEDAQALRGLAGEVPIPETRALINNLELLNARLISILGPDFGLQDVIRYRSDTAGGKLALALASLQEFQSSIFEAADMIERAGS